jgi:hypothetical protein
MMDVETLRFRASVSEGLNVLWRLVSPFDGAIQERPPQKALERKGTLEMKGLPLHLRVNSVVSNAISSFAAIVEGASVGLQEGDGRSISVDVKLTRGGQVPNQIILRYGGSSWLLHVRFLLHREDKQEQGGERSYAEVVGARGSCSESKLHHQENPDSKKRKGFHGLEPQEEFMDKPSPNQQGGEEMLECPEGREMMLAGATTRSQGDELMTDQGKGVNLTFEAPEGMKYGVGSSSAVKLGRSPYKLRGRTVGGGQRINEKAIAAVLNLEKRQTGQRGNDQPHR